MNSETNSYSLKELLLDDFELPSECSDLTTEVLDEYICHICLCIVNNPISCSSCEEMTCSKCIQKALKTSKSCPKCKENFTPKPIPKKVKNILDNMYILCPNNINCKIKTKYPFLLKDHLATCIYTPRVAICSACQVEMVTTNELKEIEDHLTNCKDRLTRCEYCSVLFKRRDLDEHKEICAERTADCYYCKTPIKVNDTHKHDMSECFQTVKRNYEALMEAHANEKCQEIYKKINTVFNCPGIEIKISDKYDKERLEQLLSLGINKIELQDYPIDTSTLHILKSNTIIQVLNLTRTKLTDDNVVVIASALEANRSLRYLDLSFNQITYKGAEAVVRSLINNTTLEYLSFTGNTFDNSNIFKNIVNRLFSTPGHTFGDSIKQLFEENNTLKVLCLSNCGMSNEEMTSIYLGLKRNTTLSYLALVGNQMNFNTKVLLEEYMKTRKNKIDIVFPMVG
jgi:hypothetical protein